MTSSERLAAVADELSGYRFAHGSEDDLQESVAAILAAPRGGVEWVPADAHLSINDNGLARPWHGRVFLNPPYGAQTGIWLGKLADHGDGVALVFARTDTTWFQTCARRADAICFVAGRIRFIRPDGTPGRYTGGAPSCLLGFGEECAQAVERCGLGVVGRVG